MSWTVEYVLHAHNWWNKVNPIKTKIYNDKLSLLSSSTNSPAVSEQDGSDKFIRIGVLSAAAINYTAIFDPVSTHPSALITGLAARSKSRAEAQIPANKRFLPVGCKAYGSYEELLDDGAIDAVYIPLPNGLHHQWTLAALAKGKHVLIEKPIASNAQQAREIQAAAKRAGKVALEAFHWRLHPAAHAVKKLLQDGEYGRVLGVHARSVVPGGIIKKGDIRFDYKLAGGASMDLTYVFSAIAYYGPRDIADLGTQFEVRESKARLHARDKLVDEAISGTIVFTDPPSSTDAGASDADRKVKATYEADLSQPRLFGFIPKLWQGMPAITVHTERAEIVYSNFMGPWSGHSITITPVTRDPANPDTILKRRGGGGGGGGKKVIKQFKGGPLWDVEGVLAETGGGESWWTTYRWQLEAFVGMIEKGEAGYKGPWVSLDESIRIMEMIDASYAKAGLPARGV